MTPDVDLRPPVFALTGRAYAGHAGIAEWLRDVDESFASARIVPIEVRDLRHGFFNHAEAVEAAGG